MGTFDTGTGQTGFASEGFREGGGITGIKGGKKGSPGRVFYKKGKQATRTAQEQPKDYTITTPEGQIVQVKTKEQPQTPNKTEPNYQFGNIKVATITGSEAFLKKYYNEVAQQSQRTDTVTGLRVRIEREPTNAEQNKGFTPGEPKGYVKRTELITEETTRERRLREAIERQAEREKNIYELGTDTRIEDFFASINPISQNTGVGKLTTQLLSLPSKTLISFGASLAQTTEKAFLFTGGLITPSSKKNAISELRAGVSQTPKGLAQAYNPKTPEGQANIIFTIVGGIAGGYNKAQIKARAKTNAEVPPDVLKALRTGKPSDINIKSESTAQSDFFIKKGNTVYETPEFKELTIPRTFTSDEITFTYPEKTITYGNPNNPKANLKTSFVQMGEEQISRTTKTGLFKETEAISYTNQYGETNTLYYVKNKITGKNKFVGSTNQIIESIKMFKETKETAIITNSPEMIYRGFEITKESTPYIFKTPDLKGYKGVGIIQEGTIKGITAQTIKPAIDIQSGAPKPELNIYSFETYEPKGTIITGAKIINTRENSVNIPAIKYEFVNKPVEPEIIRINGNPEGSVNIEYPGTSALAYKTQQETIGTIMYFKNKPISISYDNTPTSQGSIRIKFLSNDKQTPFLKIKFEPETKAEIPGGIRINEQKDIPGISKYSALKTENPGDYIKSIMNQQETIKSIMNQQETTIKTIQINKALAPQRETSTPKIYLPQTPEALSKPAINIFAPGIITSNVEPITKYRITTINKSLSELDQSNELTIIGLRQETRQETQQEQRRRQGQRNREATINKEETNIITELRQETRQETQQEQKQETIFKNIGNTGFNPFKPKPIKPVETPPPPPFTPPKYKGEKEQSKKSIFGGYNVLVKSKGLFNKINTKPLNLKSALGLGSETVERTPSATFKITNPENPGGIFTRQTPKGFYKKGNLFIEQPSRRINTAGELFGITSKGRTSKRIKKIFG